MYGDEILRGAFIFPLLLMAVIALVITVLEYYKERKELQKRIKELENERVILLAALLSFENNKGA